MTQEEKNLLLKDLLPRLLYRVKIQSWYGEIITSDLNTFPMGYDEIDIEQLAGMKPYLRPMSSMTEEEIDKMWNIWENDAASEAASKITDFLNEKYLDHHHLIERGLALEAPEGMYSIEPTKSEQEKIEELAELKEKLSK